MFSGVSNFIKKNLTLRQTNSDPRDQGSRPGDRVEDGFLLVGDTASERNTVYTNNYKADQVDLPPGYSEVSNNGNLPSYSDYQSRSQFLSPTVDNSNFQYGNPLTTGMPTTQTGSARYGLPHESPTSVGVTNASSGTSEEASNRSAIADVPFVLGATVSVVSALNELKANDMLRQRTFDYSCYEYDFDVEMRFLAEHGDYDGDMDQG